MPKLVKPPCQTARSSASGLWEWPENATALGNSLSTSVVFRPQSGHQASPPWQVPFGCRCWTKKNGFTRPSSSACSLR